jgi:hypothetical protein
MNYYLVETNTIYIIKKINFNIDNHKQIIEKVEPSLSSLKYCLNESPNKKIFEDNVDVLLKFYLQFGTFECVEYLFGKKDLVIKKLHLCISNVCKYGDYKKIKLFLTMYPYINIGGIGTGYMRYMLYNQQYDFPIWHSLCLIILMIVIIYYASFDFYLD